MKVLVSGPVESGEPGWEQLRGRVADLHGGKHGPFDLLIVVPFGGAGGVEKPENVHFPIQVALESGVFGDHLSVEIVSKGKTPPAGLIASPVDILVTETVPEGSGVPSPKIAERASAEWALATMPRYHFCGSSNTHFSRAPYRNERGRSVTRLIALGSVGGKEKWIHAFNIVPESGSPVDPDGTTDNPYALKKTSEASKAPVNASSSSRLGRQQFFFAEADVANASSNKRQRIADKKQRTTRVPPRLDCWFCLASSSCEQHLIASIAEESYIALPKGGIRKEHLLIIPISHETSFAQFIQNEEALNEVTSLQTNVEQAFARGGYAVMYTDRSLTFGKAPQQHGYLECLPVPLNQIETIEKVFHEEAKAKGIEFEPITRGTSGDSNRDNLEVVKTLEEYLFIQLPGGKGFVHRAKKASTEDGRLRGALLQFGRSIVCRLLNCPDRANWKSCVASKAQETAWTKAMSELMPSQPEQ